ncbi:hypothetical protein [Paenibacillus koleovorans]|uniref:hypothetical protein n=1 Tax=Paenibacillus koleovorans TaxID=121608 RepID=UPI000FDC20A2|nr:hypothetical protein [Paenibacillus koleovorans]
MTDIVEIGPLVVKKELLLLLASLALAWAAIRIKLRSFDASGGEGEARPGVGPGTAILDMLGSASFIVLIVWKFGHLLFQPSLLWERPLAILLMNGAEREVWLGLLAAAAYIAYRVHKSNLPYQLLLDMAAFGAVAGIALHALLQWRYGAVTPLPWGIPDPFGGGSKLYHPLNVYMLIVALAAGVRLWRLLGTEEAGTGKLGQEAALVIGIGGMLVTFADKPGDPLLLFLTGEQWVYLGLAAIGVIFPAMKHNRGRKELTNPPMKPDKDAANGDSLAQREHARESGQTQKNGQDGQTADKKLEGPNRPST